jgi:hypothetical protein
MTGMQIASLCLILFSVIVIVLGIVKVHTLPGNIAKGRSHPQAMAIEVCSLLGLLVFPLWMFALVWAYAGTIGRPLEDRGDAVGHVGYPPLPADTSGDEDEA